jgi:hypothetical protein
VGIDEWGEDRLATKISANGLFMIRYERNPEEGTTDVFIFKRKEAKKQRKRPGNGDKKTYRKRRRRTNLDEDENLEEEGEEEVEEYRGGLRRRGESDFESYAVWLRNSPPPSKEGKGGRICRRLVFVTGWAQILPDNNTICLIEGPWIEFYDIRARRLTKRLDGELLEGWCPLSFSFFFLLGFLLFLFLFSLSCFFFF